MIKIEDIKTVEEADKFYTQELRKIEEMEATNESKAILLTQLNKAISEIYRNVATQIKIENNVMVNCYGDFEE